MDQIMPYAKKKEIFRCPGQPKEIENDFSYFLGSRAAWLQNNSFSSFSRKQIITASEYIFSGDNAYSGFDLTDTDKDNYTQDCLFAAVNQSRILGYHTKKVNLLFGDGHVKAYNEFVPREMTYSYDQSGIPW